MSRHGQQFVVTLTPEGQDVPGTAPPFSRLKLFLKRALRAYGLRAVDVKVVDETESTDVRIVEIEPKTQVSGQKPRFWPKNEGDKMAAGPFSGGTA